MNSTHLDLATCSQIIQFSVYWKFFVPLAYNLVPVFRFYVSSFCVIIIIKYFSSFYFHLQYFSPARHNFGLIFLVILSIYSFNTQKIL